MVTHKLETIWKRVCKWEERGKVGKYKVNSVSDLSHKSQYTAYDMTFWTINLQMRCVLLPFLGWRWIKLIKKCENACYSKRQKYLTHEVQKDSWGKYWDQMAWLAMITTFKLHHYISDLVLFVDSHFQNPSLEF